MPKLKVLSGNEIIRIFEKFGFVIVRQKGSHVTLSRKTGTNAKQTLTIPAHDEIDKGTLKAIYNQALKYISEIELKSHFYSE